MSIPLRELIDKHCGGVRGGWDNLLGRDPGRRLGAADPEVDLRHRPDGLRRAARGQSGLGTAAVIVMDKSTDVVKAIARLSKFYMHESLRPVHALPRGHRLAVADDGPDAAGSAQPEEIDLLLEVTKEIEGHTICALGDAAAWPVQGLIRHFRPELERRIAEYPRGGDALRGAEPPE